MSHAALTADKIDVTQRERRDDLVELVAVARFEVSQAVPVEAAGERTLHDHLRRCVQDAIYGEVDRVVQELRQSIQRGDAPDVLAKLCDRLEQQLRPLDHEPVDHANC